MEGFILRPQCARVAVRSLSLGDPTRAGVSLGLAGRMWVTSSLSARVGHRTWTQAVGCWVSLP